MLTLIAVSFSWTHFSFPCEFLHLVALSFSLMMHLLINFSSLNACPFCSWFCSSVLFFISALFTGVSFLPLLACDLLWLVCNIYRFRKLTVHPLPSEIINISMFLWNGLENSYFWWLINALAFQIYNEALDYQKASLIVVLKVLFISYSGKIYIT